ncbi:ACP synthase [Thiomicrospira sp. XS5]|uniref:holo-ACP synthase n=1 Tax=Thiomicrospira sp. XS5 TaxID=1775636 RepID=UPI000748FC86|nr:holo-ACP synthase [Thiomicrospira sp. XS5]KUJ74839.1 ACP synthase [Thiomicrospira sp. XS5]
MIVGIGTDIVEIQRIDRLWQKRGERFATRVLSEAEMSELQGHAHPERLLAKRWAAKEAIAKALGTGFTQGVSFDDMTIGHTASGQPEVVLKGAAHKVATDLGVTSWSISLSDENHYAVAFVVAEKSL